MHPRVLLVEDDSVISFLVEEILVELGLDVVAAGDAAGALAAVGGGRRFDLAVIDLGLPDGTGHAVVRAARALSVPVIVSSGDDLRPEDLERAAGIGEAPVVLLRKPWNVERFTASVRRLLALERAPADAVAPAA